MHILVTKNIVSNQNQVNYPGASSGLLNDLSTFQDQTGADSCAELDVALIAFLVALSPIS